MSTELAHGDLLGFSGTGFQARAIQFGTWSWCRRLNHVAMVRVTSDGREIWESTTGFDIPCLRAGEIVRGVQCHHLVERLEYARLRHEIVWHYPLRVPLGKSASRRLDKALFDRLGLPYDYAGALWNRSIGLGWLTHRIKTRESLDWLFCSEFIPDVLREVGVFNTRNASRRNPAYLLRTLEYLGVVAAPRLIIEGRPAA